MPITVACSCGQRFAANDSLAGRRVACPVCGQAITIPAQAPAAFDPLAGDLMSAQMPVAATANPLQAARTLYPQFAPPRSSNAKPWLILAIAGGAIVLLCVLLFASIAGLRAALKNLPKPPARTSKMPAEMVERAWKQRNPGEVTWEPYPLMGGYTAEWPSGKPAPYPRNGFDILSLSNGRALGPEGPYFSIKVSSAGLLSQMHGRPGESEEDILALAIQRRQSLPATRLTKSSDFQLNGHPGKDMTFTETIDGKPIVIHVRMLVSGQHLYSLWVGGLESSLKEEDIRRFLDSFQQQGQKPANLLQP
jgi:hypothetical protein